MKIRFGIRFDHAGQLFTPPAPAQATLDAEVGWVGAGEQLFRNVRRLRVLRRPGGADNMRPLFDALGVPVSWEGSVDRDVLDRRSEGRTTRGLRNGIVGGT